MATLILREHRPVPHEKSGSGPLGGEGKIVETDETYTVYKEGGPTWILHPEHGWQKQRSGADRVPVVTLVERGGKVRSHKVENVTAATLRRVVFDAADTKRRLMTDELRASPLISSSPSPTNPFHPTLREAAVVSMKDA